MNDAYAERLMRQYRAKQAAKRAEDAKRRACPVCRREMSGTHYYEHRRSRDHILPREWGGRDVMWPGADGASRNIRVMCASCNSRLATSGHCIGAMACIMAVCRDDAADFFAVYHRWQMGKVRMTISPRGV